ADRYLGGAILVRLALWLVSIGLAVAVAGPLAAPLGVQPYVGLTLVLLTIGIGISNLSGLASALFNAAERMEVPALVTVFTSGTKLLCGVSALALGFGIVGIAVVAIAVNAATGIVLLVL